MVGPGECHSERALTMRNTRILETGTTTNIAVGGWSGLSKRRDLFRSSEKIILFLLTAIPGPRAERGHRRYRVGR